MDRDTNWPTLERYEFVEELGRGAQGRIYRARSRESGDDVAIKELDLSRADDWKAIELFERESETLQGLDHPGIPSYIDGFHVDEDGATRFFLVQEFIDGRPLAERVERADLMDESEARDFLRAFLPILDYLHSMSPPVVHRDIKPSNIMVRPDGSYALVDFGAVQTILPDTMGGSTVVGTTGFMPPEQLMGRAVPASDVYSVGATVVQLLSGHDPEDFPMERMRMQFHDYVDVTDAFLAYLDRTLDPTVEQRIQDGGAALEELEGGAPQAEPESPRSDGGATVATRSESEEARLERVLEAIDEDASYRHSYQTFVDVTPERFEATIGPISPKTGNWMVPGGLVGLSILAVPATFVFPVSLCMIPGGMILAAISIPLMWKYLHPQSEQLTIDHEKAVIERRVHPWFGDEPKVERVEIPVSQLYLPHVHKVDFSQFENTGVSRGRGMPAKPSASGFGAKQGVILTDADGNKEAFGELVIYDNRFFNTASTMTDDGELEWLGKKIEAFLTYVRGGFAEDGNDESN
ncbi:MAG: serine/threonine protein kinase [Myxococcota bacterium]